MKGEEKSRHVHFNELINKIKDKAQKVKYADVFFCKMRYLFEFVCAGRTFFSFLILFLFLNGLKVNLIHWYMHVGSTVQLVAIDRSTQEFHNFNVEFTFNLLSIESRLKLAICILNICRIISHFEIKEKNVLIPGHT